MDIEIIEDDSGRTAQLIKYIYEMTKELWSEADEESER